MIWSISSHKTFTRCNRQWFYKTVLADGRAKKNPERVEATRLSKLKTIDGWRGDIVDQILSEHLIKKIRFKEEIPLDYFLSLARRIFEKQYEIETQPIIEGNTRQFGFVDIEYGKEIPIEKKKQAWNDIELALSNIIKNEELINELKSAEILYPQCIMTFTYEGTTIKAIPDLIAFYRNKPPKIFDWKVHTFGTHSNEEQLLLYAVALKHCKPHKVFPKYLENYLVNDIALTEVQLIANGTGYSRHYKATDKKVNELSEMISNSRLQMFGVNQDLKYDEINADEFETTYDPDNCLNCGFKKLCKQI